MTETPLTERRLQRKTKKRIGDLLAVVVRAAVIAIPRIVRVIIRRIESIIFCLGRAEPVIGIVNIGAATKQKYKGDDADQRKDRCNLPTLFPFSCHAFGALI